MAKIEFVRYRYCITFKDNSVVEMSIAQYKELLNTIRSKDKNERVIDTTAVKAD